VKILVRAPNWVGDAVMAIPAIEALRRAYLGAKISILARPAVAELLSGQSFADRVIEYDYRGTNRGWLGRERLIRALRDERFDLAVLLQNAFDAAWLAWRSGIPERVGYARDGRGFLLTSAIPVPKDGEIPKHESNYYLELMRRAGWVESVGEIGPLRLHIADSSRRKAESALLRAGARSDAWRCAIAPGAAYGAAKCWLPDRFASLADRLISECDADVIFFGTAAEKEIVARICSAMKSRAISLAGETSMADLAAFFSICSVFVGNDSGAMHVAAAAGLPVIGIFGSTDPEGTSPVTQRFTLIRETVSCSPCFLRRCPVDHRCMTRIPPDLVFAAAQQFRRSADNSQSWSRQNG
jgi:heptosyltransferase-2